MDNRGGRQRRIQGHRQGHDGKVGKRNEVQLGPRGFCFEDQEEKDFVPDKGVGLELVEKYEEKCHMFCVTKVIYAVFELVTFEL